MSTRKKSSLAQSLLDAHVAFVLEQTEDAPLRAWIEDELDAALALAGKLTLNSVVTRKQIQQTARTFAAEVEFGAGVPELVGDVARALHAHPVHERTKLGDLLSDRRFAESLDQALELKALRRRVLQGVADSPLYADFVSDLLYHGIKGYLGENALTRNIPGASSMMKLGKTVLSKATPKLESSIEDTLKKYVARSVQGSARNSVEFFLDHADDDLLRDAALEMWSKLKRTSIGSLRAELGEREIEELFVNGYEFWRELRKTAYYRELIDAGIDAVFDKYGDQPLDELLADFGITRELMLAEALRYAPSVLRALKKKKLLEPIVRRNLERFYLSGAVEAVLKAEKAEK